MLVSISLLKKIGVQASPYLREITSRSVSHVNCWRVFQEILVSFDNVTTGMKAYMISRVAARVIHAISKTMRLLSAFDLQDLPA